MRTSNGRWPQELKALVDRGKSARLIAEALEGARPGLTRNAVIGLCDRMGLQLHGIPGPTEAHRLRRAKVAEAKPVVTKAETKAEKRERQREEGQAAARAFVAGLRSEGVNVVAFVPLQPAVKPARHIPAGMSGTDIVAKWDRLFGEDREGLPLVEVDGGCRWPVRGTGASTLFCSCRTDIGQSYCSSHRATAIAA